jgi:hypothetical protein
MFQNDNDLDDPTLGTLTVNTPMWVGQFHNTLHHNLQQLCHTGERISTSDSM